MKNNSLISDDYPWKISKDEKLAMINELKILYRLYLILDNESLEDNPIDDITCASTGKLSFIKDDIYDAIKDKAKELVNPIKYIELLMEEEKELKRNNEEDTGEDTTDTEEEMERE